MKTGVYIKRSVKFLVALSVLYVGVMWLMSRTGATMLSAHDMAMNLFMSTRGRILVAAVLVWAAVYPLVGFVTRRTEGDVVADRERIENAFVRSGYMLAGEEDGVLIFRAASPLRRLRLLFEDEVRVSQYGQWIVMEGIRRSVAEAGMRLNTYLENAKRNGE